MKAKPRCLESGEDHMKFGMIGIRSQVVSIQGSSRIGRTHGSLGLRVSIPQRYHLQSDTQSAPKIPLASSRPRRLHGKVSPLTKRRERIYQLRFIDSSCQSTDEYRFLACMVRSEVKSEVEVSHEFPSHWPVPEQRSSRTFSPDVTTGSDSIADFIYRLHTTAVVYS